jgi:outer membrane protein assembly factor BamB
VGRALALVLAVAPLLSAVSGGAESAGDIIEISGARPGFCIRLGATDGKLCVELGEAGYLVHGLAPDPARAAKAREHIRSKSLYGKVSVAVGSHSKLPYGDSLANLLVAENARGVNVREVARVITPYGVAVLKGVPAAKVKGELAGLKSVAVSESGGWVKISKRPPEGADEWRQWRHNATLDLTSKDDLVRPPAHLKWIYGPRRGRNHKAHPVAVRSAQGRNFIVYDKSPPLYDVPPSLALACRDAYNGLVIWERRIPKRNPYQARGLVTVGNRIYATFERNGALLELDAATGKTLRTFKEKPAGVSLVGDDLLLTGGGPVRLMDRKTGELKWTSKLANLIKSKKVAVSDGKIFAQEGVRSDSWECAAVVCLSLADGRELWRRKYDSLVRGSMISARDGVIAFASHKADSLQVLSQEDGRLLWSHKYPSPGHGGSPSNVFILGGMVWFHDNGSRKATPPRPMAWTGFDAKTGEQKKTIPGRLIQKCFRDCATEKYILSGTMNFVDWKEGKTLKSRAVRAVCGMGYFVANGMCYTFPTDCKCYPWLRGTIGLSPSTLETPITPDESPRLAAGPAAGAAPGPDAGPDDWPAYRAGPERHGVAEKEVPPGVKETWSVELGGKLTAPIAAGGKIFAASRDDHRVHAVDAASGKRVWSFSTGGQVDGPPSYYRGLAIFGCRDGYVYALRASDGKLAWRFRAAPTQRFILAYDQPESAWPIHGSVLVEDGKVYFSAGRHTDLDGGVTAFCLEAASGEVVWEKKPSHIAFLDIPVKGGKFLYMGQTRFDMATGENTPARHSEIQGAVPKRFDWKKLPDRDQPHFSAGPSSTFEDDTYAHRTRWVYSPVLAAQMLVFDQKRFICVRAFPKIKGLQKYSCTRPGGGDHKIWMHPRNGKVEKRKRGWTFHGWSEPGGWTSPVKIRPRALVLAGENIFTAGPEDAYPAKRAGMRCLSAASGKILSEMELASAPVFDGLIAAGGKLYMCTQDGKLRCFGKK